MSDATNEYGAAAPAAPIYQAVGAAPELSIVYLLTNPAMPGLVKIGRTSQADAQIRLTQLYSTGVPVPFELVFACKVPNSVEVEQALHTAFAPQRVNPKREFFQIAPEQALVILRLLHVEDRTQEVREQASGISEQEESATVAMRARRPRLDLHALGIPNGSILNCTRNDATAEVLGPRKVRINGEELSLTAATEVVMKFGYNVAPGPYWSYQGRILRDLYDEFHGASE